MFPGFPGNVYREDFPRKADVLRGLFEGDSPESESKFSKSCGSRRVAAGTKKSSNRCAAGINSCGVGVVGGLHTQLIRLMSASSLGLAESDARKAVGPGSSCATNVPQPGHLP